MTKRHWVVVGIGLTIAVVGIGLGLSPATLPNGISCGSAWSSGYVPYYAKECSDARSGMGTAGVVILVLGLAVAAASVIAAYLSKPSSVSAE